MFSIFIDHRQTRQKASKLILTSGIVRPFYAIGQRVWLLPVAV